MNFKDISKEELETMSYDEIAYLVLEKKGKKMKLLDLFQNVCKILNLPESMVEERIADFFELLSINKKFVLLENGFWDLAINHLQDIVVEDEEDTVSEELLEEDDNENSNEYQDEEDIFYDNDLDDSDEDEDDLKDLVVIDEDENIE